MNKRGKKILLVFKNPIINCPRPRRLALTLAKQHEVNFICPAQLNEAPYQELTRYGFLYRRIRSPFIRKLKRLAMRLQIFSIANWIEKRSYLIPSVEDGHFDYIFVHDLFLYPHFSKFVKTRVIFDAREFYPLEMAEDLVWKNTLGKLAEFTCKKYLNNPYKVLTVSPSLVEMYQKLIGRKVHYFPSYPREELRVIKESKRKVFPIRFIHHGGAMENRGLERMIDLMRVLGEGYQLDLMLIPMLKGDYIQTLKKLAADMDNIRFIQPVHPDEIIPTCSQYDFGLYIMAVNESQNRYCLPNKFFEFVFAGLPLITSFSQDMKKLIDDNELGLGFLDESIEEIAAAIRQLTPHDITRFRHNVAENTRAWTTADNVRLNLPELHN